MTTFLEPLTQLPLTEADADRHATVLGLLSNPARLRLLTAVYLSPMSTVAQLAEDVGLNRNHVSSLLGALRRENVVEHEMFGRSVCYRVSDEFARSIISVCLKAV